MNNREELPTKEWLQSLSKDLLVAMVHKQALKIQEQKAARKSAISDGYKLVPVDPTLAMIEACLKVHEGWLHDDNAGPNQPVVEEYKAMLAAAPEVE